jgi:hypothetical protein
VLGRARAQAVGRFGLRASPGGFATPAFGDDHAVVRVGGEHLVVERGSATAAVVPIAGSTLRALTTAAGADVDAPFDAGGDAPPPGDVDEPLDLDPGTAAELAAWYDRASRALERVLADLGATASPSRVQLWPEHFDIACDVAAGPDRCNLGASPGDPFSPEPYLYVGPWRDDRPGPATYWNAPFGASLRSPAVTGVDDAVAFFRRGLALLADAGR